MPSWGKHTARIPPHGQIRISQVVSTFGPGSLVDLVDAAVLVGGLDFWTWGKGRLVRAGRRPLSIDQPFREPPMGDDKEPHTGVGLQVLEFPAWFVCQRPECRALVRAADGLERKGLRYFHMCTGTKQGSDCVPVRWVAMCKRGHLEDIPWIAFAHTQTRTCAVPQLRLVEGATGDFSEITVECACGASEQLSTALTGDVLPWCEGRRPWLGTEGDEVDDHGRC